MTYGALTMQEEETKQVASFKKTVAVVFAATCLVGAVVAMSSLAVNRSASAVNANRNKGTLAAVPGVAEKTQEVLNITQYGYRYAIFSFIPCCTYPEADSCDDCKMIPTVQGMASSDWSEDWERFTNAIDTTKVAAAVYNFEYFTSDSTTEVKPILITWAAPGTQEKTLARAGYYLGSVILATDGVHQHYPLTDMAETYGDFCKQVMGVDPAMCDMESDFRNCPFENGICDDEVCASASFSNPDEQLEAGQGIEDECCAAMFAYCDDPLTEDAGCHPTRLRAVTRLCAVEDADETPDVILPEDEVETCEPECANPCAFIAEDDPKATYKMCSGCAKDGAMDEEAGFRPQCAPGAIDFMDKRCCGLHDACGREDSQNEMQCNALDNDETLCEWAMHKDCDEIVATQKYEAAPIGCCDGADGVNQMDCEGEFAEGDCPPPAEEGE